VSSLNFAPHLPMKMVDRLIAVHPYSCSAAPSGAAFFTTRFTPNPGEKGNDPACVAAD
jgi:hypothetical protein